MSTRLEFSAQISAVKPAIAKPTENYGLQYGCGWRIEMGNPAPVEVTIAPSRRPVGAA